MTTYETQEDVRRALKAGAKGYLLKEPVPQQIRTSCGESLKDRLCFQQR
jgi:DNA-binding NarL/FixJ family response regulator